MELLQKSVKTFAELDEDGSGKVTATELLAFLGKHGMGLSPEHARAMVEFADTDGDGVIAMEEFVRLSGALSTEPMDMRIQLFVPSTSSVSVEGTEDELQRRQVHVLGYFAGIFGGATAGATCQGAYKAESGELVFEQVVPVQSYTSASIWESHGAEVREEVRRLCEAWGQECMGLDVDGTMEYLMPEENPTPEKLWKSVIKRLHLCHRA